MVRKGRGWEERGPQEGKENWRERDRQTDTEGNEESPGGQGLRDPEEAVSADTQGILKDTLEVRRSLTSRP